MPRLIPRRTRTDGDTPSAPTSKARPANLEEAIDAALAMPTARIHAHVDAIRAKRPGATPADVIRILERRYLLAVSASGGAVGAAAAIPAVGTGAALALTAGQVTGFVAASAALALAVADVHGIAVEDAARRRALLMTAMLGEKGPELLEQQFGVSALTWGRTLLTKLPLTTVKAVNKTLRGRIASGAAAKAGSVMLGRLLPFGIGAAVGYAGSRMLGTTMISGVREAFGPAPATFVRHVEATFTAVDDDPLRLAPRRGPHDDAP